MGLFAAAPGQSGLPVRLFSPRVYIIAYIMIYFNVFLSPITVILSHDKKSVVCSSARSAATVSGLAFCGALRLSCGVLFAAWYSVPCKALLRSCVLLLSLNMCRRSAAPAVAPAVHVAADCSGSCDRFRRWMPADGRRDPVSRSPGTRGVCGRVIM